MAASNYQLRLKVLNWELLGQQALTIRCKLFGEDHPHTASSLDIVGSILGPLNRRNEALEFCQQALFIRQKLLGETHPDTMLSQHNVIRALKNISRKAEAIQRFQTQFQKLKPGDPHYQQFLELRADLYPGCFRKNTNKPGKGKKRRR